MTDEKSLTMVSNQGEDWSEEDDRDVKHPPCTERCPCLNDPDGAVYIQCDSCEQWWHCGCVSLNGLTDEMVKDIVKWECHKCFKSPYLKSSEPASATAHN